MSEVGVNMFRIGLGQDSHKLIKRGTLVLGGVEITRDYAFEADSDGDVIIHSLCNALSSAIGGGSLDTWAGAMFDKGITDSKKFLDAIFIRVKEQGYSISNVSIIVEAGKPKLEGYRVNMQESLAKLLRVHKQQIGITFTSGEGLTGFGKGQGIQAFSMVLLEK